MKLNLYDSILGLFRHWSLQTRIGYRFKDLTQLDEALTHASVDRVNNERLEFLGDAVLELVVSEYLYRQYSDIDEGTLTQLKIMSVNNVHLQSVALNLGLDEQLFIGKGLYNVENRGVKMYADAVEALIGAIYIDGGLRPASKFIDKYVIQTLPTLEETQMHPKTALQNWVSKQGMEYPEYDVVQDPQRSGSANWQVKCTIKRLAITRTASARSRKAAETAAARQILDSLGIMANGA
ncbi:MAG: ribonuclease III [Pseudomonadales bacterium]|nr:ribonuclease III [Pseudomonadales bacterium]